MRYSSLVAFLGIAVATGLILAGCGGGGGGSADVAVTISPESANVATGGTQTFTATVTGTGNRSITWSIREGAAGGTITSTGSNTALYTAPQVWNTFHIEVTSDADPSKSATATVRVGPPLPPAD